MTPSGGINCDDDNALQSIFVHNNVKSDNEYVGSPQGSSSQCFHGRHYFLFALYDKGLELKCCGTAVVVGGEDNVQWSYTKKGQ